MKEENKKQIEKIKENMDLKKSNDNQKEKKTSEIEMREKEIENALEKNKVRETMDSEIKEKDKTVEKIKEGKKALEQVNKKEEAIAKGFSLPVSKRQCMYICSFIKNKDIDTAIEELEQVIKYKRVIPFKGEIPHRKEKGVMSGRYPIKASKIFIGILKGLKGNIIANGLELVKTRMVEASASWASRPQRKTGVRFKRTNVILKAKEMRMEDKKQK